MLYKLVVYSINRKLYRLKLNSYVIPNNKICDIVNIYYFLLSQHNESIVV